MEGRLTTPPTTPGVQKRARQGKVEGIARLNKRNHVALKCAETMSSKQSMVRSTPSMLVGEAQPLSTGARELGYEHTRKG
jgi:hypothetical protein